MESAPAWGDLCAQRQKSTSEELFPVTALGSAAPGLQTAPRGRQSPGGAPRTLHAEGEGGGKGQVTGERRGRKDADFKRDMGRRR